MYITENNLIPLNIEFKQGQRCIKIGNSVIPVGVGGAFLPGSASDSYSQAAQLYAGVVISDSGVLKIQPLGFQGTTPYDSDSAQSFPNLYYFDTGHPEPQGTPSGVSTDFYKCTYVAPEVETISPQDATATTGTWYSISASTEYSSNYAGWKAFNGESGTDKGWFSSGGDTAPWIQIQFTSAKVINAYNFGAAHDSANQTLSAWTLQGSNNGTDWTDLDSRTGQSLSGDVIFRGSFTNSTAYYYYRLSFSSTFGYSYIGVQQMKLIAHNSNPTWSGRKAVLKGGIYSFQSDSTEGLTYGSGYIPEVGMIYDESALVSVSSLWDGIPTQGLVFYAPLSSAQSTAETGQTIVTTGTVNYGVVNGVPCADSDTTKALYVDEYMSDLDPGIPKTLSVWIHVTDWNVNVDNNIGIVCSFQSAGGVSFQFNSTRFFCNRRVGSSYQQVNFGQLSLNSWYHLAFTDDGNIMKTYVHGALMTTAQPTGNYSKSVDHYKVGITGSSESSEDAAYRLHGYMAAVRLYNRVLSQAEIAGLASEFTPTA